MRRHPSVRPEDLCMSECRLITPDVCRNVSSNLKQLQQRLRKQSYPMICGWIDMVTGELKEEEKLCQKGPEQSMHEAASIFVSGAGEARLNGTYVYEAPQASDDTRYYIHAINKEAKLRFCNSRWELLIGGQSYISKGI